MFGKDRTTFRRFLEGVGGQAYFRGVYLVYTICLVPVLISGWGVKGYGGWLVLTALTSYITASSTGLASASIVDIMQAVGAGDVTRASKSFQNACSTLNAVTLAVTVPVLIAGYVLPLSHLLNLETISDSDAFAVLCFMAIQVWALTIRIVVGAVISGAVRYGVSDAIAATVKFIELVLIWVCVGFFHAGVVWAAAAVGTAAMLDLFLNLLVCRRYVGWAKFNLFKFDRALSRKIFRPTAGNFVLSIAVSAVTIQAPRIVLSIIAGSGAVAIFGVYATMMRAMEQVAGLISATATMEVARESEKKRPAHMVALISTAWQFSISCALIVSGLLFLVGYRLFGIWTRGGVPFEYKLLAVFVMMGIVLQVGKIGQVYLIGVNKILGPSLMMLAGAVFGVAIGAELAGMAGVIGMALGCLVGEFIIAAVCLIEAARHMGIAPSRLLILAFRLDLGFSIGARKLREALRQ